MFTTISDNPPSKTLVFSTPVYPPQTHFFPNLQFFLPESLPLYPSCSAPMSSPEPSVFPHPLFVQVSLCLWSELTSWISKFWTKFRIQGWIIWAGMWIIVYRNMLMGRWSAWISVRIQQAVSYNMSSPTRNFNAVGGHLISPSNLHSGCQTLGVCPCSSFLNAECQTRE